MQTPKDTVSRSRLFAKLAVIAAIVAVIRYFLKGWLAPLGVPAVIGSFLAPITIVLLAGMVLVFLSEGRRSDGRYWKAAASFAGLAIWCEALIIGGILLTERTGKDTYYSGPWDMIHEMFPDQTAHVIGHTQGIVFIIAFGLVIGAAVYFLSKRGRLKMTKTIGAALPVLIGLVFVHAWAAVPPVPKVSSVITGPGLMYPNPPVNATAAAVRVEDFPYLTEEFFVSGAINDVPYTTRIIVRRPRDVKAFSGTVVSEALHSGGRSLVFEWSRLSILTRNHIFVEIVHSPANVTLLKNFNAERYASLNIAAGQTNEVIAQVGRLIKSKTGPFDPYDVKRITLMGTSASSGTVRGYLGVHANMRMPDESPIFDGFLLTSTNGNTPLPIVDVPMIQMPTQTEVVTWAEMGIAYRRPDSDEPANRFRLYEVAGMPHNNSRESPGFLNDPCTLPVTDFPAGAFTALALNYLIEWVATGKTPPHAPPIVVDRNPANDGSHLALDEFGNAKGGIRNVWVDVPVATYGVFGKGKTQAQDRLCQLAGTEVRLPEATLRKLYRNKEEYVSRADQRLTELIVEGWFLPEYAEAMRRDFQTETIP